MKHYDDGGTLTFFAEGERGLIACSEGHYWTFTVDRHEAPTKTEGFGESIDVGPLAGFGPSVLEALGAPVDR